MRAVVLRSHGGPEVLDIEEVANPTPGPEEVLCAVRSAALNRADLLQRAGLYPGPPNAGYPAGTDPGEIPGLEFSGTVLAVGARVTRWSPGDAVMSVTGVGCFAEQLVTHERMLMPVPASVPVQDAAAIPEVWVTAWDALLVQAALAPGGTALVHAGGSGVGTAAIQLCTSIGANVVVTCSAGKVQRCVELGATAAVDYANEDFVEVAQAVSSGRGVNAVLDVIGGEYLERNIDALAIKGTIIQVGIMGEGNASFPLGKLLPKRATLTGTVLRSRPLEEKLAVTQNFIAQVLPGFDNGRFHPVIDRRFDLDHLGDAQDYLETNASFGKVLIDVS